MSSDAKNFIFIYNYVINRFPSDQEKNTTYDILLKNINGKYFLDDKNNGDNMIAQGEIVDGRDILEDEYESNDDINLYSIDLLKSIQKGGGDVCSLLNEKKMHEFYDRYVARGVLNIDDVKMLYTSKYNEQIITLIKKMIDILKTNEHILKQITHVKEKLLFYTKNAPPKPTYIKHFEQEYYILHNQGLVYNIKTTDNIIIFGDLHGSYHSFFRNLLRLQKKDILNMETFHIKDEYKLVFLGDISDNGLYSLEILSIIAKFFVVNNEGNDMEKWKIFLNRGHTEDFKQYNRFSKKKICYDCLAHEINTKIDKKNIDVLKQNMYMLFSLLSSAIIINTYDQKFWLCHGGFPSNHTINYYNDVVTLVSWVEAHKIRWNDFGFIRESKDDKNCLENFPCEILNHMDVTKFKADFIIRGHQDDMDSACILSETELNENNNHILLPKILINGDYVDCFASFSEKYNDGPIYMFTVPLDRDRISVKYEEDDEEDYEEDDNEDDEEEEIILSPVLTISTCNDYGKFIGSDSFIMLVHDEHNIITFQDKLYSDPKNQLKEKPPSTFYICYKND